MEQYSEKQREIFQKFYEDCRKRGVDPTGSEADRQRALLLAQENADLVRIFGEKLDRGHVEAYRMGKQRVEEQAAAEKKAAEDAKIAEQRKIDEQAAAFEKELSKRVGREKRMVFFQVGIDEANAIIKWADQQEDNLVKGVAKRNVTLEKESSWGTLGGIAAGITGSTAVGAVVAADTMRKNEEIRKRNADFSQQMAKMNAAAYGTISDKRSSGQILRKRIEKETEKVKLHLTEDLPIETLMQGISLGQPEVAFTEGNTMLIRVGVQRKQKGNYRIAGDVDAVLDGCFIAEVYDGNKRVGDAYLNLPRDGLAEETTIMGHCLEAAPGHTYTVLIFPLALWLIEKYTPPAIPYTDYTNKENKYIWYYVKDLGEIITTYQKEFSWKPIEVTDIPWEKRAEERRAELKREAEEERLEAERRANEARKAEEERKLALERAEKKKKAIMIAAIIVVAAILLPILFDHFF